jgi:hypothetical protein
LHGIEEGTSDEIMIDKNDENFNENWKISNLGLTDIQTVEV